MSSVSPKPHASHSKKQVSTRCSDAFGWMRQSLIMAEHFGHFLNGLIAVALPCGNGRITMQT
jgi:hypothetical protein